MLVGPLTLAPLLSYDVRAAVQRVEPTSLRSRSQATLLVALICVSAIGVIASMAPSLGVRSKSGPIGEYAISVMVAPVLWAGISIAAIRALAVTTPRRLAVAGIIALAACPILIGIRVFHEPVFDLDDEFVLVAPRVVQLYVACALVASGLANLVILRVSRWSSDDVIHPLPRATALDR